MTYATDRLYAEIAYVAYYLHWSRDDILDLEHAERQRFVAQIAALNTRAAAELSEGRSDGVVVAAAPGGSG